MRGVFTQKIIPIFVQIWIETGSVFNIELLVKILFSTVKWIDFFLLDWHFTYGEKQLKYSMTFNDQFI